MNTEPSGLNQIEEDKEQAKAVFDYLEKLPATYLSPKYPVFVAFKELLSPRSVRDFFDELVNGAGLEHAENLSKLASKIELKLIKEYFDLEIFEIDGKLKKILAGYTALSYILVIGVIVTGLYKIEAGTAPVAALVLAIAPTGFLILLILVQGFGLYQYNEIAKMLNSLRKCQYLLGLAEIIGNKRT